MILVGTGDMAREYARVFRAMGKSFSTIGNTEKGCKQFYDWAWSNGVLTDVHPGGVNHNRIESMEAVVAVPIIDLFDVAKSLILKGIKKILIEKPGCLYSIQARALISLAESKGADLRVAYNRRFFNSVQSARTIIRRDGVSRLFFCFGDDMNWVGDSPHPQSVKDRWIIANSSHCIDTALFITGEPVQGLFVETVKPFRGSGFAGDIPFHYQTDWHKDKRWRIEFMTKRGEQYYLTPMEKLIRKDEDGDTMIAYEGDDFKPGMSAMMKSFLVGGEDLPTMTEQLERIKLYMRIGGLNE